MCDWASVSLFSLIQGMIFLACVLSLLSPVGLISLLKNFHEMFLLQTAGLPSELMKIQSEGLVPTPPLRPLQ